MGRIKTDMVKRTTRKIVKSYNDRFSPSFDKNKLSLNELAEVRSKKLRNIIAGYAVRLKKQETTVRQRMQRRPSSERGERGDRDGRDHYDRKN